MEEPLKDAVKRSVTTHKLIVIACFSLGTSLVHLFGTWGVIVGCIFILFGIVSLEQLVGICMEMAILMDDLHDSCVKELEKQKLKGK